MIDKKRIKIVKRVAAEQNVHAVTPKAKSTRAVAREMVSTVSEWVSELKERKRLETKAAIDLLLATSNGVKQS